MAIKDMKGTVSTGKPAVTMTGMINQKPNIPDMSKMKMPVAKKTEAPQRVVQKPVEEPKEANLLEKVQNLTNEDKAVLATVLSPSVSSVLGKIAPELNPLLQKFTKEEENVTLPVSIVKNFASRKYPGTEAGGALAWEDIGTSDQRLNVTNSAATSAGEVRITILYQQNNNLA